MNLVVDGLIGRLDGVISLLKVGSVCFYFFIFLFRLLLILDAIISYYIKCIL